VGERAFLWPNPGPGAGCGRWARRPAVRHGRAQRQIGRRCSRMAGVGWEYGEPGWVIACVCWFPLALRPVSSPIDCPLPIPVALARACRVPPPYIGPFIALQPQPGSIDSVQLEWQLSHPLSPIITVVRTGGEQRQHSPTDGPREGRPSLDQVSYVGVLAGHLRPVLGPLGRLIGRNLQSRLDLKRRTPGDRRRAFLCWGRVGAWC
jgi:hypothetical protein